MGLVKHYERCYAMNSLHYITDCVSNGCWYKEEHLAQCYMVTLHITMLKRLMFFFSLVSIIQFSPAGRCCNHNILLQKAFFSVEGYSEVAAYGDKMHAT